MALMLHPCGCSHAAFEDPRPGGGTTCWLHSPDPHDLRAVFPDTTRSRGPTPCGDELPLLGLSKDRPSIVSRRGVHSRWPRASKPAFVSPSGREVPTSHPCSALVVFHHLDGFLLPPAACGPLRASPPPCRRRVHVAARFRPWGSRRFCNPGSAPALANRLDPASHFLVVLFCPSKLSLPTQPR
jgi:hypothetical protein